VPRHLDAESDQHPNAGAFLAFSIRGYGIVIRR